MAYISDISQLGSLADELRGHYSERDKLFDKMKDTYLMRPPATKPQGVPWHQTPSAHNAVNLFIEMLSAQFPLINVTPQGPGKSHQDRASQKERFLRGV